MGVMAVAAVAVLAYSWRKGELLLRGGWRINREEEPFVFALMFCFCSMWAVVPALIAFGIDLDAVGRLLLGAR